MAPLPKGEKGWSEKCRTQVIESREDEGVFPG